MKKNFHIFYYFWLCCALFFSAGPLQAAKYTIDYEYDLVRLDIDELEEPPGIFKVSVSVENKSKDAPNPLTQQILQEAASEDLAKLRDSMDDAIKETRTALLRPDLDKEVADKFLSDLNKIYVRIQEQAESIARQKINAAWKKIQDENTEYSDWQIDIAVDIAKDTFNLGKTIASAVGTSGVSLIKDFISMAESIYNIGNQLYKVLQDEETARKNVQAAMDTLDREITGTRSTTEKIKDFFAGSKKDEALEEKLDLYKVKLTAARKKAEKLAIKLNLLLNNQDELKTLAEKKGVQVEDMPGVENIFKSTQDMLDLTQKVFEGAKDGMIFHKQGNKMLKAARKNNKDKLSEWPGLFSVVYSLYKDVNTVMDPLSALQDKAVDLGAEGLKELIKYASS